MHFSLSALRVHLKAVYNDLWSAKVRDYMTSPEGRKEMEALLKKLKNQEEPENRTSRYNPPGDPSMLSR